MKRILPALLLLASTAWGEPGHSGSVSISTTRIGPSGSLLIQAEGANDKISITTANFRLVSSTMLANSGLATLGNISTTGGISVTGNVSAIKFIGDGSLLTGVSGGGTSNYNALTNIPVVLGNISSSTGSVTVTTLTATKVSTTSIDLNRGSEGNLNADILNLVVQGALKQRVTPAGTFMGGFVEPSTQLEVSGTVSATSLVGRGAYKAMVIFSGTSSPTTVHRAENVSAVNRTGTASFRIIGTFPTTPGLTCTVRGNGGATTGAVMLVNGVTPTTTEIAMRTYNTASGADESKEYISCIVY